MAVVEQVPIAGAGRRRLRLACPATLEALGEVDVAAPDDVLAAVEGARKAQPSWAELSFGVRGRIFQRAARLLTRRCEEFADVIVSETGKPRSEALAAEILPACDALEYYAKHARRILSDHTLPTHRRKTRKLVVSHRPVGVVGIITPWNLPFLLSINPTVQALMAGNTVVLKPSEATPRSGQLVEELLASAGLPDGVFQLLTGDAETGAALVESGVDRISFTGSADAGRCVAEACGRRLVPHTLELGGKDPMIVCADADLVRAARGAVFGAFANAGQVCSSTERVYVVEEVADEFTQRVLEEVAKLRQGSSGEFDVGAIVRSQQLETIDAHVADATARGARVLAGGRRNPLERGFFYEPTVLVDVDHEMRVMREETFGPVLPIMRVRDEEEALRLANDSRYGLGASVWTRSRRRGAALARAIDSGNVVVNDCMVTYGVTEAPFGGVKDSGVGRVNGELGLKSYCHTQSIVTHRLGGKSERLWYPYSSRKTKRIARMLRLLWGTSLGRLLA